MGQITKYRKRGERRRVHCKSPEGRNRGPIGFCSIHWLLSSGLGESNEEEGIFAISVSQVQVQAFFFSLIFPKWKMIICPCKLWVGLSIVFKDRLVFNRVSSLFRSFFFKIKITLI